MVSLVLRHQSALCVEKGDDETATPCRVKDRAKHWIRRCTSSMRNRTSSWTISSAAKTAPAPSTKQQRLLSFLRGDQPTRKQQDHPLVQRKQQSGQLLRATGCSTRLAATTLLYLTTLFVRPAKVLAAMAGGMGGSKGPVVPMSQYVPFLVCFCFYLLISRLDSLTLH